MNSTPRLWYFAYGSMCNPVSLQRRGLFPDNSHPAVLKGYRLAFQLGGMANIVADADSSCHGILHSVTEKEFAVLQEIESNYQTVQVPVTPYTPHSSHNGMNAATHSSKFARAPDAAAAAPGGPEEELPGPTADQHEPPAANSAPGTAAVAVTASAAAVNGSSADGVASTGCGTTASLSAVKPGYPVTATAFIVHPPAIAAMVQEHPEWITSLPSARYIRIITAGLQHHGADPQWVMQVAAEPCKHGRQPDQYLKLPRAESAQQQLQDGCQQGLPTYTEKQLAASRGQLQDDKVVLALGPRVYEVDVSAKPSTAFVRIIQKHCAGRQVAFHMCMMLHEPRLPPISCPADLRKEHIEWAEDAVAESLGANGYKVRQVGWLQAKEASTTAAAAEDLSPAAAVEDAKGALYEEDEASAAPDTGLLR